ncbi:hypothetical protein C0Q70_01364, partial [Pomacea canaliculata]
SLMDEEINTFSCTLKENKPLIDALYVLFESKTSVEDLDPVCHQLFEFYRSKENNLRKFALEFVPSLIWLYLHCLSLNDKKTCGGLEAFLLGVYNLEIVHSDGSPKIKMFRVPSIGQGSVYHEHINLSTMALSESTLSRYNKTSEMWSGGPCLHYEAINGQNRQAILTQLIQVYNNDIAQLSHHSHNALCISASRIAISGLPSRNVSAMDLQSWPVNNGPRPNHTKISNGQQPSLAISPALLVEILWGINFAMYNGCTTIAKQAVQDVHLRACYELLADVQLVTEAILNSERLGSGLTEDGLPMGISYSSHGFTKSAITNASFKAKKLPDDISVIADKPDADHARLSPIEEESKGGGKLVARIAKGKKEKERDKPRGRDAQKESDTSSNKSLVLNGDGVDGIIKNQQSKSVEAFELKQMNRSRHSGGTEDSMVTNGNSNAVLTHRQGDSRGSGEGQGAEVRSRPSSFIGAPVNPESYSTDL